MINTISSSPKEALDTLIALDDFPIAVMLWGMPGCGKTSIVSQMAEHFGVPLKDVRLSQKVASDIGGLPALDHVNQKTTFYIPDFLPTVERDGERGILFLDELPGADDQTRIAAYGLILERRVGSYTIPAGWRVIAAGNRPEDDPINREFGTALNDRLMHIVVEANFTDWSNWAVGADIAPEVLAFLKVNPHRLITDEKSVEEGRAITPSPRSWERVSELCKKVANHKARSIAIAGVVGDAVAHEFEIISKEVANMTPIEDILRTPAAELHKVIPATISGLYAFSYAMNSVFDKKTANAALKVLIELNRLKGKAHDGLAMAEVQTLAFSLVIEKALKSGLDISEHPSFIEYNNQREADMARR